MILLKMSVFSRLEYYQIVKIVNVYLMWATCFNFYVLHEEVSFHIIIFRLIFYSNFFFNLLIHFKALLLIASYIKNKPLEVGHKFSEFVC